MDTVILMKIEFLPKYRGLEKIFPHPQSISSLLPEWWKKQKSYLNDDTSVHGGTMLLTVKKCQAVFDSMTFGYYLLCPMDLSIDATGDTLTIDIPNDTREFQKFLLAHHLSEQIQEYPIPNNFHKQVIRIHPMWVARTEPGYSCLFINPMHGSKSPLQAIPGLIDTDKYVSDGYLSFFVEKGFKGIIEQGTPIVQVIPFKRDDWESSLNKEKDSDTQIRAQQLSVRSVFRNGYRKKMWSKKIFR